MAEIIINKEKHECAPAVAAYIKELKAENARLEEGYQKSVGVIAATDCVKCKNKEYINDVNYAISCIRDFCRSNNDDCETCAASKKDGCMFVDYPDEWENLTALIDDGGGNDSIPEWASGLYDKFIRTEV